MNDFRWLGLNLVFRDNFIRLQQNDIGLGLREGISVFRLEFLGINVRLEFIIQEYDYILKDERVVGEALEKIKVYAGLREESSWEGLLER